MRTERATIAETTLDTPPTPSILPRDAAARTCAASWAAPQAAYRTVDAELIDGTRGGTVEVRSRRSALAGRPTRLHIARAFQPNPCPAPAPRIAPQSLTNDTQGIKEFSRESVLRVRDSSK